MEKVHDTVTWYQQKIGSYDKQLWEQSVEQKVLKGIQQAPRRSVRPKTELIDVDLVRGSTFTKTKPKVPWTAITLKTISRVLLFPFHYRWWIQQTSVTFWLLLLGLYCLQIFTAVIFFQHVGDSINQDEQTLTAVVIPGLLMVLLGLIHSQTVLTHFSLKPARDNKRDLWRRKRSLSQPRGSTSTDPAATVGQNNSTADIPSSPSHSSSKTGQYKSGSRSVQNQLGSRSTQTQSGSRSTRERVKERKARNKTAPSRVVPAVMRANLNYRSSQDSESAYISHEASDSVADRTSSHDQDSNNGHNSVGDKCDEACHGPDQLLTSSSVFDIRRKECESQESDMPESHDEKAGSHSEDQMSNSDEEPITTKVDLLTLKKQNDCKVVPDVRKSDCDVIVSTDADSRIGMKEAALVKQNSGPDADLCQELDNKVRRNGPGFTEKDTVTAGTGVDPGANTDNSSLITGTDADKEERKHSETKSRNFTAEPLSLASCQQNPTQGESSDSSYLEISYDKSAFTSALKWRVVPSSSANHHKSEAEETPCPEAKSVSSPCISSLRTNSVFQSSGATVPCHSVDFKHGNDLVKLRQITPLSSRESSPSHTQSETIVPSKQSLRSPLSRDSESETENEVQSYQSLPNIRRRKVTVMDPDTSCRGGVPVRRPLLSVRQIDKNSTGISSSEGETESTSPRDYQRNTVSSEEWGDHIQSDVSTSSYSSSCASDGEMSATEKLEEKTEPESSQVPSPSCSTSQGVLGASHIHIINLLQPSTSQSSSHSPPDKVTCIIWEGNECKKVELTAMDIGWAIIDAVDKIPESSDYILIGLTFSLIVCLTPLVFQAFHTKDVPDVTGWGGLLYLWNLVLSNNWKQNLITVNAVIQRLFLGTIFFFLHSVADRTYKQRLLYAKHFCYLTSARRSRKFDMPHFRLNKVRNIKTWLSLRSYLKKRGPQRSVDVIVSSSFLITLIMLILMCLQLLRDAEIYLDYMCNWELMVWTMAVGVYLLRFMTLGLRLNKKYRNLSVLITEQINLYLQMEQKPHKKDELMVANNVLKLAESLLKELESPFKISGISANPFVLNVTKVVVLSAFSAVLTELLGFKLKLYKIKLRA